MSQQDNILKQCIRCGFTKSITEYSKHSSTADRLDQRCKECAFIDKENAHHQHPRELDLDPPNLNNPNWQGGTIFKRTGDISYTVRVDDKSKTFNLNKFNS